MSITLKEKTTAEIVTPVVSKATLFIDSADEHLKKKLSSGAIVDLEINAVSVSSVFGRTGTVVAAAGDYIASEIDFVPSGDIVATNVQSALEELDSEKLPLSHEGSGGSAHALVSVVSAGFMSAADKSKLDGIEAGATVQAFSNSSPQQIGVASPGVDTEASRSDHVHAHGNQLGGSLHATASSVLDGFMSSSDKSKLDGVAAGATANQTDAFLLARANHTGTQLAATISDFSSAASAAAPVQTVAGQTGAVVLSKSDVGLGSVDNTADTSKTISGDVTGTLGASTVSNAVVIAKLLTGLNLPSFGQISSSDTILTALEKVMTMSCLQPIVISSNLTVPSGHVFIRPKRTKLTGSTVLTLVGTACLQAT